MTHWLADAGSYPGFFSGPGQGSRQIIELFGAFGLTALIGLEREVQGKSAGLRTQIIVGTAAALILLISKYGFNDVLVDGLVVVDPSRVAAQIVSGIGFLGAGIIIFRRGSVHGLTTAAAVWESAAIGMAASVLRECDRRNWQLSELSTEETGGVILTLTGNGIPAAPAALATIDGITSIRQLDDDPD